MTGLARRRRDSTEFEQFYRTSAPGLLTTLRRMGATSEDAHDAMQESMLAAFTHWATIDEPLRWVRALVLRTWMVILDSRRDELPTDQLDQFSPPLFEEDSAARSDLLVDVWEVMHRMPLIRRTVAGMHYVEHYTANEIATALRMNPSTVRTHIERARRDFRSVLPSDRSSGDQPVLGRSRDTLVGRRSLT